MSESESKSRAAHLRTKYAFIDTQAFRKARFDWNGRILSRLAEFAKRDQLRLLITDVTAREVKSQLRELVSEAYSSLTKYSGILEQLGAFDAIARVQDQSAALSRLEAAFDQFLRNTKAITVPLVSDVEGMLDDYFARRPPFSSKKKAEFPDAISIKSIRAWCQQNRSTTYVVSEDPDLRACCSDTGPLFYAASIADIITQATVSQELHVSLEAALRASDYLSDELAGQIKDVKVNGFDSFSSSSRGVAFEAGKIERVDSIKIISVNILEQQNKTFTCELEVEAEVALDIDVEVEGGHYYGYGMDDWEPARFHSISQSQTEYFYAEVVVRFEPSTAELEFESIYVGTDTIKVSFDDVSRLLRRWL